MRRCGIAFALLSVSFDPDRDTPEVLASTRGASGADPAIWHFVTGSSERRSNTSRRIRRLGHPRGAGGPGDRSQPADGASSTRDGTLRDGPQRQRLDARGSDQAELRKCARGASERPARAAFTAAERRVIRRLADAGGGAAFLNALPYNTEPPPGGATLRSFRGVVRHQTAHCLEAALVGRGHPRAARLSAARSQLRVDRRARSRDLRLSARASGWGSIARSRDPGLHGRKPVFTSRRAISRSVMSIRTSTYTGRITGYAVVDLRVMGDLRLAAVDDERVEGRADAARLAAPVACARRTARYRPAGAHGIARSEKSTRRSRCTTRGRDRWTRAAAPSSCVTRSKAGQSRSKSRVGLVIGSCFACRSASSNRFDSASPRVFSAATDSWNIASRRAASSRQDPLRIGQLRPVAALGLLVPHDPAQVRVDDERRLAARAAC